MSSCDETWCQLALCVDTLAGGSGPSVWVHRAFSSVIGVASIILCIFPLKCHSAGGLFNKASKASMSRRNIISFCYFWSVLLQSLVMRDLIWICCYQNKGLVEVKRWKLTLVRTSFSHLWDECIFGCQQAFCPCFLCALRRQSTAETERKTGRSVRGRALFMPLNQSRGVDFHRLSG